MDRVRGEKHIAALFIRSFEMEPNNKRLKNFTGN